MSKLMFIFGILFMSAGLALGFLVYFSPGQMQVWGLTPDLSAILMVGGALCLGQGGLIGALRDGAVAVAPVAVVAAAEPAAEQPSTPKFTGFGRKAETAAAKPAEAVAETPAAARTSVADTISALEQAKTDIAMALGVEAHPPSPPEPPAARPVPPPARPEPPPARPEPAAARLEPEPKAEPEEVAELYVVEERVIRGRPARVLSDGTVEAETDEGWMRFENLEHLDEYLEAMVPEA